MDCPYCKSQETIVIKLRRNAARDVRRRRECLDCGMRMTTVEHLYETGNKGKLDATRSNRG